jgi:hypothetical protein
LKNRTPILSDYHIDNMTRQDDENRILQARYRPLPPARRRSSEEDDMNNHRITGVFSAAATPLNADGSPDLGLFTEHCRRLLEEGCHGVALLGTTGEANSFSSSERRAILEAALKAGVPADKLLPGTGVVAIRRNGGTDQARPFTGRYQGRDAAALLLQGRFRRRTASPPIRKFWKASATTDCRSFSTIFRRSQAFRYLCH